MFGEYTNLRVYKSTAYLLKLIAAKQGKSMIEVIQEFAEMKAKELGVSSNDDEDRKGHRNRNRDK